MQPNAHKSELQTDQFLMLSALVEVFAFFPWQMQDIRRDSESYSAGDAKVLRRRHRRREGGWRKDRAGGRGAREERRGQENMMEGNGCKLYRNI